MHLEKIEIQGFKSFAPKTTIDLDQGITAIVGPNGSGKSNIADAVRWVMGEQSMKNLRGKKSEDIIFAGSKQKAKMGMAEVSLCLNNEDGRMPVDYSDVVLTRRIYRSGESEYLLNKSKVRLLDFHELLAKSGFGQKTYSVIGQGMIDAILRSSPKERREMFEEAAGIKQYQLKRNSSINKLERTKQNITRINDLLLEIEPRRRSLKRQAKKAQKKDEIQKELKTLQTEYFNHCWNRVKERLGAVINETKEYKSSEREVESRIEKLKEDLNQAEINLDYKKEDVLRENLNNLVNSKSDLREKLAILNGRIEVEGQKKYSVSVSDLEKKKSGIALDTMNSKEKFAVLKKEKENLLEKISRNKNKLAEIEEKKSTLEADLLDIQAKTKELGIKDIQKELKVIHEKQGELWEELEACHDLFDLEKLKEKAKKFQNDFDNIFQKINEKSDDKAPGFDKIENIQSSIGSLIAEISSLTESSNKLEVEIAVIDTKISAIEEILPAKETELKKITEQIENIGRKDKDENSILNQLTKERLDLQKKLTAVDEEIKKAEGELHQERKREQESRQEIFNLEKEYRQVQEQLNSVRNKINESEIKKTKIESDREILIDEIKDNTPADKFDELILLFEEKPSLVEEARAQELKNNISKIRGQLYKIGEIDPAVISEYEECENRYNYLYGQKEDLENAVSSLKKIIAELDDTISEKFNAAFTKINEQFQKYFEILFGGGHAKLIKRKISISKTEDELSEEEENNQSKTEPEIEEIIDIKATPPGKKLKELNMLSGGEKALTSIALLFAIITNNPAPFIVLDEVDAALDESNTGRYADIISSLAEKSQFIIITHNRESMRRANLMYGVAMDQAGISKLLSVKLSNLPNN